MDGQMDRQRDKSDFIGHCPTNGNITATISDHLLTFIKEVGQNLNKKTLYLTILINIEPTYCKLINNMLIFLWILFYKT